MTTKALNKCKKAGFFIVYLILGIFVCVTWSLGQAATTAANGAQTAVGFTENGHPYRGSPDAPIILEEYSDYLCPFCGRHFNNTYPTLV